MSPGGADLLSAEYDHGLERAVSAIEGCPAGNKGDRGSGRCAVRLELVALPKRLENDGDLPVPCERYPRTTTFLVGGLGTHEDAARYVREQAGMD